MDFDRVLQRTITPECYAPPRSDEPTPGIAFRLSVWSGHPVRLQPRSTSGNPAMRRRGQGCRWPPIQRPREGRNTAIEDRLTHRLRHLAGAHATVVHRQPDPVQPLQILQPCSQNLHYWGFPTPLLPRHSSYQRDGILTLSAYAYQEGISLETMGHSARNRHHRAGRNGTAALAAPLA